MKLNLLLMLTFKCALILLMMKKSFLLAGNHNLLHKILLMIIFMIHSCFRLLMMNGLMSFNIYPNEKQLVPPKSLIGCCNILALHYPNIFGSLFVHVFVSMMLRPLGNLLNCTLFLNLKSGFVILIILAQSFFLKLPVRL